VIAVALAARLAVVAWAASAIPPTADGTYYHRVATRIAEGHGYTWLWPDGAVTHAAHYPVGYPGMIAGAYALLGPRPVWAMLLNALLGAAAAWGVWELVGVSIGRRLALAAALAVALHPALVPYTAALMTEGVTTALLVVAAAFAVRARGRASGWRWLAACGLAMGLATLVRPQSIALAPVLGALSLAGDAALRPRLGRAAAVLALALAVCAPWTARNCVRMDRCALVSVNGGWNLAIGTQTVDGAWKEIVVPEACREVFAEAAKDRCFGDAALGVIAAAPGAYLARAPAKLRATFDYFGAAPWYLHAANPERFPYRAKVALGAVETLVSRLLLAAALVAVMRWEGRRRTARLVVCGLGLLACLLVPGFLAYLACVVAIGLLGLREMAKVPILGISFAVLLATAGIHVVFFGAGRYGLVVVPFVAGLAFLQRPRLAPLRSGGGGVTFSSVDAAQAIAGSRTEAREGREAQREESPSSTECDAG